MTYREEIANYLKHHKGITSREAIDKFGCTRLSAVIFDLKNKKGMNITKENVKVRNRHGHYTIVSRYRLEK